jgi:hypothetical protein
MLRTPEEKTEILSRLAPSQHFSGVVPAELIDMLKEVYRTSPKNQKPTGPITVDYYPRPESLAERGEQLAEWWIKVDEFITPYIGEHDTFTTNFFEVTIPHILHNDDSVLLKPRLHKTIVIPLEIVKPSNFAVFDQCYLDGPVKLRHGGQFGGKTHDKPVVYYNNDLLDNNQLEFYTGKDFDSELHDKYFTHIPYRRFHGLSVESIHPWAPGDLIIFDTARIHCSADFVKQGIEKKIGFSIFTSLK